MSVKLDTLWDKDMRRDKGDGVDKGYARWNSPYIVDEKVRPWFADPLVVDLKEFYASKGSGLGQRDLEVQVSRVFGERLLRDIGLPRQVTEGFAVQAAIQIMREDEPIKRKRDTYKIPPNV